MAVDIITTTDSSRSSSSSSSSGRVFLFLLLGKGQDQVFQMLDAILDMCRIGDGSSVVHATSRSVTHVSAGCCIAAPRAAVAGMCAITFQSVASQLHDLNIDALLNIYRSLYNREVVGLIRVSSARLKV